MITKSVPLYDKYDLAALRKRKGLTQSEVAKHFGIIPNTYMLWEHNPLNLKLQQYIDLVTFLTEEGEN